MIDMKESYERNGLQNRLIALANDYSKIDEYIKENCAFDCRYFILKVLSVEKNK